MWRRPIRPRGKRDKQRLACTKWMKTQVGGFAFMAGVGRNPFSLPRRKYQLACFFAKCHRFICACLRAQDIEGKWLHAVTALAGHDFPLWKRRRSLSPAAAALPNSLLCQRRLFAWLRRQGNAIAAKEEYRPLRPSAWIRKRNMVRSKKRAQHSGERNMDATFEVPSVSVEVYTSSVRHAPALHRGGQVQDRHEQSKQRVKGIQGSRRANFGEFVCECFADTA